MLMTDAHRRPLETAIADMERWAREAGRYEIRRDETCERPEAMQARARMRGAEADALVAGADRDDLTIRINRARSEGHRLRDAC
jgi:hypothetical protein